MASKPDAKPEHIVEILIGPIAKGADWPRQWGVSPEELGRIGNKLRVWLDGNLVWETELRHPFDALESLFDVGANRMRFSTAEYEYPGFIQSTPYSPEEARAFLRRNLDRKP
jgi:hypothetical protein